jgi:hypothetical protein
MTEVKRPLVITDEGRTAIRALLVLLEDYTLAEVYNELDSYAADLPDGESLQFLDAVLKIAEELLNNEPGAD